MSVGSFKEPLQTTVPPVQVNPFGNAQAQDHVILCPLSQEEIIVLQHIVSLKESRGGTKNTYGKQINISVNLGAMKDERL